MVPEYMLVYGRTPEALAREVNERLAEGFVPLGGMVWVGSSGFYQTMMKYPKPRPKAPRQESDVLIGVFSGLNPFGTGSYHPTADDLKGKEGV